MILHYTKEGKLVKIEILNASITIMNFLEPILSQKSMAKTATDTNQQPFLIEKML